jgi:hypothetical protein
MSETLAEKCIRIHELDQQIDEQAAATNTVQCLRDDLEKEILNEFMEAGIAGLDLPETGHYFAPSETIWPKWNVTDTDERIKLLKEAGEGDLITTKVGFNAGTLAARVREFIGPDGGGIPEAFKGMLETVSVWKLKKLKSKS